MNNRSTDMSPFINELVEFVRMSDGIDTESSINAYFDQIVFSIEKSEWERMTDEERQRFAQRIDQAVQSVN